MPNNYPNRCNNVWFWHILQHGFAFEIHFNAAQLYLNRADEKWPYKSIKYFTNKLSNCNFYYLLENWPNSIQRERKKIGIDHGIPSCFWPFTNYPLNLIRLILNQIDYKSIWLELTRNVEHCVLFFLARPNKTLRVNSQHICYAFTTIIITAVNLS